MRTVIGPEASCTLMVSPSVTLVTLRPDALAAA
jgi:hypothetical protein